jgi:hypothetical protein
VKWSNKYHLQHSESCNKADKMKNDITDAYAEGKISEQHYNILDGKISDYKKPEIY